MSGSSGPPRLPGDEADEHEQTGTDEHGDRHRSGDRAPVVLLPLLQAEGHEEEADGRQRDPEPVHRVRVHLQARDEAEGGDQADDPDRHVDEEDPLPAEGVEEQPGALLRALTALGARKVVMVTPYMKPLTQLVSDYVADAGFEVLDTLSLEVSDNIAVANLDPTDLTEHWTRLDPWALEEADALILSACVQMLSLPAIQAVEDKYGKPVLSAATATAWTMLTDLGLPTEAPAAGSLLGGSY